MKKLTFAVLALMLALPARAGLYYSNDVSATSDTLRVAGVLNVAPAATPYAYSIRLNGTDGRVTANDATLTYGLTAATGSFSGSVTASSGTILGAGLAVKGGQGFAAPPSGYGNIYGLNGNGLTLQGETGSTNQLSFLEASGSGYWAIGRNPHFYLVPGFAAANVGIGLTAGAAVTQKLHVGGSILANDGIQATYGLTAATGSFSGSVTASSVTVNAALDTQGFRVKRSDGGQTGGVGIDSTGSNYGTAIYRDDAEAAIFENGGLILGSYLANNAPSNGLIVSGSVGIGTASPGSKLHVSSGVATVNGTGYGLRVGDDAALGATGATVILQAGANDQLHLRTGPGVGGMASGPALDMLDGNLNQRPFSIRANTMAFMPGSALGINTNVPATMLDVNGNAQFGSGVAKSTFSADGSFSSHGGTIAWTTTGIVSAPSNPRVRAFLAANVAIPTGSSTELYFGNESYDKNAIHETATSSSSFVVPVGAGGAYLMCANVRWEAGVAGARHITAINRNGTDVSAWEAAAFTTTEAPTVGGCDVHELSAGDVIKVIAFQNATATRNVLGTAAGSGTFFTMKKDDL